MAPPSSSRDRNSRGSERRSNPAVIPGLIALVLIAAAIGAAVMTKKGKDTQVSAPAPTNPFADMPPEVAPPPKEHKAGSNLPPAPDSIVEDPQWVSAVALAAEARELYEKAMNAKAKGDLGAATTAGKDARKKYNDAIEQTAAWEEDLLAKYNPYDQKVSKIKDARTDWFNKLRFLEKSIGH